MKTSKDLIDAPQPIDNKKDKEAPIQTAYRYLTTTDGALLELMTRANPTLARAAHLGYIFNTTILHDTPDGAQFGNAYVAGYIEQIERVAVSMNGGGRRELIDALTAGGRLPDSYYMDKKPNSFTYEDGDD